MNLSQICHRVLEEVALYSYLSKFIHNLLHNLLFSSNGSQIVVIVIILLADGIASVTASTVSTQADGDDEMYSGDVLTSCICALCLARDSERRNGEFGGY
jgi:hypothetical protein